jgi:hypothetical protein
VQDLGALEDAARNTKKRRTVRLAYDSPHVELQPGDVAPLRNRERTSDVAAGSMDPVMSAHHDAMRKFLDVQNNILREALRRQGEHP